MARVALSELWSVNVTVALRPPNFVSPLLPGLAVLFSTVEAMGRSPGPIDPLLNGGPRNVSILPSSAKPTEAGDGESMDITPPSSSTMGPPAHSSPDLDPHITLNGGPTDTTQGQTGPANNLASAAAATSSQQPKVVQTAFIHKLYK